MTEIKLTSEQYGIVHSDINRTMLIVAGAGSGKTFTMTQRIIELIKQGVEPHKILGLTFTKAAANELLTRVGSAVYSLSMQKNSIDSEERTDISAPHSFDFDEHFSNRDNIHSDDAFLKPEVYTYDAFFQSIVRQYGLLVGMDPSTVPLSEAGAFQIADSIFTEKLRDIVTFIQSQDNNDDTYTSENADNTISSINSYESFIRCILQLSQAISACMIDQNCTSMDDAIERIRRWDTAFIRHIENIIDRDFSEEKKLSDFGKKVDVKINSRTTYEKWQENNGRLYLSHILVQLREKTAMRNTLLDYVQLFVEKKRALHMAEFSDFTIAAMQLVERFPWIAQQYRARFTHVFLDEYQDTSTTQAVLIAKIFAPDADNASAITAVGDPYQAIYGWRGAAPGAFASFMNRIPSGAPLSLSKTVRNPSLVLDLANKLTDPLREGHYDAYKRPGTIASHEVRVKQLSVLRDDRLDDAEGSVLSYDKNLGSVGIVGYHTYKQEIDGIVRYARTAVEKSRTANKERIKRGEKGEYGPYVAILLRAKTHIEDFVQPLIDAGLTVQVSGASHVLDRPDARDLLNVLRILSDTSNSCAVLNLLATARFGLSSDDLSAFARAVHVYNASLCQNLWTTAGVINKKKDDKNNHTKNFSSVVFIADVLMSDDIESILRQYYKGSDRGKKKILAFADALQRVQRIEKSNLENIIRCAGRILSLDVDVAVAYAISRINAHSREALPVSSVETFVDMARTYTADLEGYQQPSIAGFVAWVDSQKKSLPDNPSIIGSAHADVIICTIHSSKGLEWDSVIIPQLQSQTFPTSRRNGLKFEKIYDDQPIPDNRYVVRATSWLTDPVDIPHPVRADERSVSYFPHAEEFTTRIPDAQALESLAYGFMHDNNREALHDIMSVPEEAGQSIVEDERRLMYVAVTRAKRDVLLTYSEVSQDKETDNYIPVGYRKISESHENSDNHDEAYDNNSASSDTIIGDSVQPAKQSIFWNESYQYLSSVKLQDKTVHLEQLCHAEKFMDKPIGIFLGNDADSYARATVLEALHDADNAKEKEDDLTYQHPRSVDSRIGHTLSATAIVMQQANDDGVQNNQSKDIAADISSTQEPHDFSRNISLLDQAHKIHQTLSQLGYSHTIMSEEDGDNDQRILQLAQKISDQRHTSVTRIQKEYAQNVDDQLDDQKNSVRTQKDKNPRKNKYKENDIQTGAQPTSRSRSYQSRSYRHKADMNTQLQRAQAMIRPVPNINNYLSLQDNSVAHLGTLFHSYAQLYFLSSHADYMQSAQSLRIETEGELETKIQQGSVITRDEELLHTWKMRLINDNTFSPDICYGTEIPFAYTVSATQKVIVGIIDAIFYGEIFDNSPISRHAHESGEHIRYTIIDWKTGSRPSTDEDIEQKLLQIDMYREIFATLVSVPLEYIDAALYYVSEEDEEKRVIHARPKTHEEIQKIMCSGHIVEERND